MNENSPENLRKFLESDDPAMVRMGLSMAKGIEYKVALEDIRIFREMNKFIPEFLILVEENNLLDEPLPIWITHEKYHFNDPEPFWERVALIRRLISACTHVVEPGNNRPPCII